MADGNITVTLKSGTGFDSPWVVIGAQTANEMRDRLGEIEQSGLLVDVGRVSEAFKNWAAAGGTLGARPTDAPVVVQTSQTPPNGQGQPQYGSPGNGSQGGAQQPQQGQQQYAPQGQQQQQQQQQQQPTYQGGQQQQGQQQQPADGGFVKDNFGNDWEYDVPGAPMTPRGPAIIKRGVNKNNGNLWRKWSDPAAGPKWFSDRQPKVATADRWQGEFAD